MHLCIINTSTYKSGLVNCIYCYTITVVCTPRTIYVKAWAHRFAWKLFPVKIILLNLKLLNQAKNNLVILLSSPYKT